MVDILGQTNRKLCYSSSADSVTAVQYVSCVCSVFDVGVWSYIFSPQTKATVAHWYRHGLVIRMLQVQSLLSEIFFITIICHNYAFDHHTKLWVCSKTYIFFIKCKTVNFFCHAWESNRGPVQTLLLTWEIFPSIWLCT